MSQELKLNRNSTSFQLKLFEYFKKLNWDDKYEFLKYYQNIAREYVNNVDVDSRGLLIYHHMGLGKSILAVSIAIDQIERGRQIIFLLTKSLQDNMRGSIKKYVKLRGTKEPDYKLANMTELELDIWIKRNFSFVSMNAGNMLKQMGKASEGRITEEFDAALEKKIGEVLKIANLNGKLLIVDEAHNLFRAITNGSKNAIGLYDLVIGSKNLKCMFLTGTPIANDPFELVPCFNMLGSSSPGIITLPENYKDFTSYFVGENGIKNREKFQNRINGLVSHVTHHSTPGAAVGISNASSTVEFPEELPTIIQRVPMDGEQYIMYKLARDHERDEGGRGPGSSKQIVDAPNMIKPKSHAASSYRVRSRQLGNYCPPEGYLEQKDPLALPRGSLKSAKFEAILRNMDKHSGQLGIVYSQFIGVGGLGTFAEYLKENNWQQISIGGKPQTTPNDESGELDEYIDEVPPDKSNARYNITGEFANRDNSISSPLQYLEDLEKELHIAENIWLGSAPDKSAEIEPKLSVRRGTENDIDDLINLPGKSHGDIIINSDIIKKPYSVLIAEEDNKISAFVVLDHTKIQQRDKVCAAEVVYIRFSDSASAKLLFLEIVNNIITCSKSPKKYEKSLWGGSEIQQKRFAVISGEISAENRTLTREVFNSSQNIHGGVIDLLLISSTGAEGLDLHNVRHIHIMEPYWNFGRIAQIKARGIRNDSHIELPPDEKNVQTYIYLAVAPPGETTWETQTTDEELYRDSIKDQKLIESFESAIREVSIECMINNENCRVCGPTDSPLFTDNIQNDLKATDPCSQVRETTVKAKEITVNNVKYYYTENEKSIYGYKVFKYDEDLNIHRQLREDSPQFISIMEEIYKKENRTFGL